MTLDINISIDPELLNYLKIFGCVFITLMIVINGLIFYRMYEIGKEFHKNNKYFK